MRTKNSIPYDKLPEFSKNFVNEMQWRAMLAMGAIRLLELSQKQKKGFVKENIDYKSISEMSCSFAISQISALIDGRGKLSMKISKNQQGKYILDRNRLKKLLPSLTSTEFLRIYSKISKLLEKNKLLVDRILYTRHNRIAHAGVSCHSYDRVSIFESCFPKKQFMKFADKFESIAYQIIFGIELT